MKKTWIWGIYLFVICIMAGVVKNAFNEKEALVWISDIEETYGFTIQVHNHLGETLSGVSFRLYEYRESSTPLRYINSTYISGDTNVLTLMETTTRKNGVLHFYGLKKGIYYLEEIKVPSGYRTLENRITICVDEHSTERGIDYYVVNGALKS